MTFKKLAQHFSTLESTASRNSMTEVLSDLFKEATSSEIDKIAYLLQGRVAPLYEPIEFGMAEKMIVRAIALAFNKEPVTVTAAFKKSGDIGIVAEKMTAKRECQLSISEVFTKLNAITEANGEGSVEKKIGLLSDLLKEADSLSARYIARIPVDKLRLGFSDMTMLDGLSWMIDGTKKHKDVIEAAYNIRPDLGYIAKQVKESGIAGVAHIKPKVGAPILVMRAERLNSAEAILEKVGGKAAVEPKLDGLRTQVHFKKGGIDGGEKVRIFSRGLENVTAMYPDVVAAAEQELDCDEVILDGEAIGFDPKTGRWLPFQETVQRKRKYDIEAFSQNVPLRVVTFDVLYLDKESMIDEPYEKRREILVKLLNRGKIIVPAEMHISSKADEVEELFNSQLSKGLEGIMVKKLDGRYLAGARGWNWIKLKGSYTESLSDTVDGLVMGLDFGQGKRNSFGVGAFLIGIYDKKTDSFKTISKVGTGLTDQEWRDLASKQKKLEVAEKPTNYDVRPEMKCDVWLAPELVGEFKADELTKSPMHTAGYALRFPRLVRWREKKPEDATSMEEIVKMAKMQKKT